jgi:hypothetical protein
MGKIMRTILTILVAIVILYGIDVAMNDGRYFSQLVLMARQFGLPF